MRKLPRLKIEPKAIEPEHPIVIHPPNAGGKQSPQGMRYLKRTRIPAIVVT